MPEALKLWLASAVRSLDRGIGPPAQAPVCDLGEVAAAEEASQVSGHGVPEMAKASFVVACWWLLREAEALALDLNAVRILNNGSMAEIRLGMTKTDYRGRGARRLYQCVCACWSLPKLACPACCLASVVAKRRADGAAGADPLFADAAGGWSTASGMVRGWKAATAGVAMRNDLGEEVARQVSGHTARRSGAQWLARRAVPLWAVQYAGRWGSDTVRRYTAQAYAELHASISRDAAEAAWQNRRRIDQELWSLVDDVRCDPAGAAEAAGKERAEQVMGKGVAESAQAEAAADEAREAAIAPPGGGRFVRNRDSGIAHATHTAWSESTPFSQWKARCGWVFAGANVQLATSAAPPFCKKCFKGRAPAAIGDDDSEG